MQIIDSLKDTTGSLLHTASDLGKITVDTLEKASGVLFDSCVYYNRISFDQLRVASGLRDFSSLRGFFVGSAVLSVDVIKHAVEDLQKSLALATEMRIAIEDALSTVTPPTPVATTTRTQAITKSTPI